MPGLDGFGVLRRIRADRRTARLPVVAVSAVGPGPGPDRVREAGFDGYLRKPFELADLVGVVETAARRHDAA